MKIEDVKRAYELSTQIKFYQEQQADIRKMLECTFVTIGQRDIKRIELYGELRDRVLRLIDDDTDAILDKLLKELEEI